MALPQGCRRAAWPRAGAPAAPGKLPRSAALGCPTTPKPRTLIHLTSAPSPPTPAPSTPRPQFPEIRQACERLAGAAASEGAVAAAPCTHALSMLLDLLSEESGGATPQASALCRREVAPPCPAPPPHCHPSPLPTPSPITPRDGTLSAPAGSCRSSTRSAPPTGGGGSSGWPRPSPEQSRPFGAVFSAGFMVLMRATHPTRNRTRRGAARL